MGAPEWIVDDPRPIGLTGSIAGGKSTVLALLAELGLRTASSDVVAREIFQKDDVQAALAQRLGTQRSVTPVQLREKILTDPSLRRWTNRLIHPLVGERLALIDADVVEVPLLFEACLQSRYREVWCVACGREERARRLAERYGPEADLEAFERWQLDEEVKCALADFIVRTDRPREAVLTVLKEAAARRFSRRIAQPE